MKVIKKLLFSLGLFAFVIICPTLVFGCMKSPDKNPPDDSTYSNFTISATTLTAYEGNKSKVEIPSGVTNIASEVFASNEYIEEIVIPDSVTEIGNDAFRWCSNLKKVHIGAGVEHEDLVKPYDGGSRFPAMFGACYNLQQFTVSQNNQSLKSSQSGKSLLTKDGKVLVVGTKYLEIPEGVETIGQSAFFAQYYGLENTANFTIPNTVKEVGAYAFYHVVNGFVNDGETLNYDVEKAVDLVIPSSVEKLNKASFRGMNIRSVDFNSVLEIEDLLFYSCKNLKSVELLEGITKIGYCAFHSCNLEFPNNKLTIPTTVRTIDTYAFYNAFSEKYNALNAEHDSIEIALSEGVTSIGDYTFASKETNKLSISSFTFPKSITDVGSYTFANTEINNFIYTGDVKDWSKTNFVRITSNPIYLLNKTGSVQSIKFTNATSGLYEFTATSDVVIPEGVTRIGKYAFPYLSPTTFSIPATLTEIAEYGLTGLSYTAKQILLPANLTIKPFAFSYSKLNLIIPANLTKIESSAFYGVNNTLTLEDNEETILNKVESGAWDADWNTRSVSSSGEVTSTINATFGFDLNWYQTTNSNPQFTFSGYKITAFDKTTLKNDGTDEIIIPQGTKEIGASVFIGVGTIYKLVLPSSLEAIGANAFGLGTPESFFINIEYNGTANQWSQIDFKSFYANPIIRQSAYKGSETKTLKFSDFDSTKDSILKIGVPTGASDNNKFSIKQNAFAYVKLFENIEIGANVIGISKNAFEGVEGTISISSSLENIGASAFAWSYSTININLTESEFELITKDTDWNKNFKGKITYKVSE